MQSSTAKRDRPQIAMPSATEEDGLCRKGDQGKEGKDVKAADLSHASTRSGSGHGRAYVPYGGYAGYDIDGDDGSRSSFQDSTVSVASRTTTRSHRSAGDRPRSSSSLRISAKGVAGSCITCFVPRRRSVEDDDEAYGAYRPPGDGIPSPQDLSSASYMSKESSVSSLARSKDMQSPSISGRKAEKGTSALSMDGIRKATGNFSTANIIGQGRFGTIYKGQLKDGSVIAVKRAKKDLSLEFKNEIQTLSQIEHLNLVRYFGYLEKDNERVIVFEYVSNGSLRDHLDGSRGPVMEMAERLEVAIDIAHAITYLHTYTDHPVIHRDVKASNILITDKLRAKVADFGFAHLAPDDPDVTHISTQVKGTEGYMDPEYIKTYQLTEKSDVYSYGVLLVELVTGRRPIEPNKEPRQRLTTKWAMAKYKAGDGVMVMDPRLRRNPASVMAVEKLLGLAYHCVSASRRSRPSMKQCTEILWGIRKDYQRLQKTTEQQQLTPARRSSSSTTPYRSQVSTAFSI